MRLWTLEQEKATCHALGSSRNERNELPELVREADNSGTADSKKVQTLLLYPKARAKGTDPV